MKAVGLVSFLLCVLHAGALPAGFDETGSALVEKIHCSLVIGVISRPKHLAQRDMVRRTWGSMPETACVRFVIGEYDPASERENLVADIAAEEQKYKDLVRVPVREDYWNLTLKVEGFMDWAVKNTNFQYLMKTDDDSYVNIQRLLADLETRPKEKFYMGHVWRGTKPERMADQYPHETYPPFCAGAGYVLSYDLAQYISDNMHRFKKYRLEDVGVGVMLSIVDLEPTHNERFHPLPQGCDEGVIVQNPLDLEEMQKVFEAFRSQSQLCAGPVGDIFKIRDDLHLVF